jgi:predicted acetyltransferase
MKLFDGLWLRILDVAAALEARTWGIGGNATGSVVLDLADAYCPWNAGRWKLDVTGGRAEVTRTDAAADLALSANELGAMYLGGISASALAAAGRVTELNPSGLAAVDVLFATAVRPWCPQDF